jgi:predicted HTH domain antitoxin
MQVVLDIPDVVAARLPMEAADRQHELLTDLVCGLYADWKVNSGHAAKWLGISRSMFWDELGKRRIPRQITPEMIEEDASLADSQ